MCLRNAMVQWLISLQKNRSPHEDPSTASIPQPELVVYSVANIDILPITIEEEESRVGSEKTQIRTRKGVREYSYLGCPLTRNRSAWCFRLCTPDAEGHGRCGRVAPHSLKSSIQSAIEKHKKKQFEGRLEKLERDYLAAPDNRGHDPGIRLSEGEADIVLPIKEEYLHQEDGVLDSVCFKAMNDSAVLAVCTLVDSASVFTIDFRMSLTHAPATCDLVARGRFVGMSGNHYLAEAMLTDSFGAEIGRGEGVFVDTPAYQVPNVATPNADSGAGDG